MANNLIQIKRTSVSGRAANSTTLTNPGELALNMTDGIMYSTNGSTVFEVGANLTSSKVTGTLTVNAVNANGSVGTNNQVLKSNGTVAYWSNNNFNALSDVPTSYTGFANAFVVVNPNANGLTFATDFNINAFNFTAVTAPATPAGSSVTVYLTASGVSPNMEVAWKIKNELGEEVILSSILV